MQCRLRDRRSRLFSLGLRPCPLRTEIPPDSLNLLIMLCTVEGEISKSLPIFLWGTLFLNISIIFSRICWQTGDPRPIFAPKGLDLSWMLLLYQIIITITCWHQLFQITSLFKPIYLITSPKLLCHNFFWNVLQVWMTGKDVYLQMTWSWPDKTWIFCVHIVCNEIQVKVNLEITTFFFYLRFPYCPNFFWFGVVHHVLRDAEAVSDSWTNWLFSINLFNRFANHTKRFIHELEWSDCSCSRVENSLIQMNRLERVFSELNSQVKNLEILWVRVATDAAKSKLLMSNFRINYCNWKSY